MDPATIPHAATAASRVLVVDDNRDAALSLALLLSLQGYETLPAFDGIEALERFESFDPGVVLLDINLPRLDGFEVARRMRDRGTGRPLLLVATSGFGRDEDRARAVRNGFDAYLVKPVEPATLQALLPGRPCAASGARAG